MSSKTRTRRPQSSKRDRFARDFSRALGPFMSPDDIHSLGGRSVNRRHHEVIESDEA